MAASSASMIHAAGLQEAEEVRRQGRRIGGQQAVGYGKAGVRLDKGTPVQVMAETAARAELAAMRTQFAYDLRAWEVQAAANRGAAGIASSVLMSIASLAMGYAGGPDGVGGTQGPAAARAARRSERGRASRVAALDTE